MKEACLCVVVANLALVTEQMTCSDDIWAEISRRERSKCQISGKHPGQRENKCRGKYTLVLMVQQGSWDGWLRNVREICGRTWGQRGYMTCSIGPCASSLIFFSLILHTTAILSFICLKGERYNLIFLFKIVLRSILFFIWKTGLQRMKERCRQK